VAEVLARGAAPHAAPPGAAAGRAHWRAPLRDAVREPLARLVALLDEPAAVPYLARARTEEVLYRLLAGPEGARLRAVAAGGGRTAQVARAIALLQRTLDRPMAVAELARAAHMSATSLHRHFRALTALSPGQYHKRLRLHEARRLMLAEGLGAAEAAARVAYRSASQFSRDYRRVYGRPPHRDVAAARAGPGP
jgi:transcriptional regulator GlxA family with amidase domain